MAVLESEKELEDYLYCDGSGEFAPSNRAYDFCMRQLHIHGYGTMDLVYVDVDHERNYISIEIVELKKENLDLNAVAQIARYRQGLLHYLSQFKLPGCFGVEIKGTLVGGQITGDDTCFLIDSIPWLDCYVFDLSLEKGLTFKAQTKRGPQTFYWSKTYTSKKTALPLYLEVKRCLFMKLREDKELAEWHAQQAVANA